MKNCNKFYLGVAAKMVKSFLRFKFNALNPDYTEAYVNNLESILQFVLDSKDTMSILKMLELMVKVICIDNKK